MCMMRSTPIPTHFPYTTLFRSRQHDAESIYERAERANLPADGARTRSTENKVEVLLLAGLEVPHFVVDPERDHVQDRKSTRLNSSHLGISYAVFCLKKKKTSID